jgi:Flp pilus assembly CpaE family ATPase
VIVAVTGGKGGPGATVLAVRLAGGLARRGHDVLLADLDPAGGDVAAYLDPSALDPRRGLLPLLKLERGPIGGDALVRELQSLNPRLKVLLGLLRPAPDLVVGRADGLLKAADRVAEIVVADLGRAWPGSPAMDAQAAADRIVLAARADLQGALAAERALGVLRERRGLTIAATRIPRLHGADLVELSEALAREIPVALPDCKPGMKGHRPVERALDLLIDHLGIEPVKERQLGQVAEAVAS